MFCRNPGASELEWEHMHLLFQLLLRNGARKKFLILWKVFGRPGPPPPVCRCNQDIDKMAQAEQGVNGKILQSERRTIFLLSPPLSHRLQQVQNGSPFRCVWFIYTLKPRLRKSRKLVRKVPFSNWRTLDLLFLIKLRYCCIIRFILRLVQHL
jgi:hypothetical protein